MSYVTEWVCLSVSRLRRKSHHSSVSFDSCKTQEFDYVQVKEELGYHPWAAEMNLWSVWSVKYQKSQQGVGRYGFFGAGDGWCFDQKFTTVIHLTYLTEEMTEIGFSGSIPIIRHWENWKQIFGTDIDLL